MLTTGVALLLALIALSTYDVIVFLRELKDHLSTHAEIIEHNTTAALIFHDKQTATEILTALNADQNITIACIYTSEGSAFAWYLRDDIKKSSFSLPEPQVDGIRMADGHMIVFHGIIHLGERIGTVYLQSDLEELFERLRGHLTFSALLLIAVLLVAFLFSLNLQRVITEPILDLAEKASLVSSRKDYSIRVVKHNQDEIGTLVDRFNEMLTQIQKGDLALHEAHEKLEERVGERTKELETEITKRKQAEEELRLFAHTISSIKDCVVITDLENNIIFVNRAFLELYGFSEQELLGKNISVVRSSPTSEKLGNEILSTSLASHWYGEIYNIRKDGSEFPIELWTSCVVNESGDALALVGVGRDISERKRAEKEKSKLEVQLRQSQKMQAIGTLAGGIAHDFNNILWVIMGNTEMSLRKLSEDSPIRAKQQEILTASKRAKDLVEQILTFSRQKEQESKPLQLHLIVRETVKLLAATLPSSIKIRQNIDKECGTVIADPTELHQMIMNLCTNAYQAMGENGGLLEVSLGTFKVNSKTIKSYPELQEESYIEVTISDTGCGMDKATLERIFEPFFTTREVGKGTGLGLDTVHGIVKSLGGAIKVYSEPGKGSTFRVFLPRHDGSLSEEPPAPTDFPELKGNEHILFIDDEKQVVSMVQEMLQELGYDITTQTSSVEALKQLAGQPDRFDLVITDQTMPDMTGMELADHILHIRPDMPVILATGYSKLVTEEKIRNSGIREYLRKPIVFHDLETVVRRVLDDNKDND